MALGPSKLKSQAKAKKISFEYYAPQAKKVELAGSFNNWKPVETPLRKEKEGKWKVELNLPPGLYQYRYRVDDAWQNDQRPVECVPNAFGTWNCVLRIS